MKTFILSNKHLTVDIKVPDNTYKGSRFDRTGMVEKVILDDTHTFCGLESKIEGQGSGGRGFYNEFGIEHPVGYAEAKVGDQFQKIGVGQLTKASDEPYDFFHTYSVEELEYNIESSDERLSVSSTSKESNGYQVSYTKKIRLVDNKIIVDYTLKNLGTKAIDTTEYCHNFITINDYPIGPNYSLNFSYPVDIESSMGDLSTNNNTITWDKLVSEVLYATLQNFPNDQGNFIEVIHTPTGVGVRETVDFKLYKVAVWGMPHVISPEAFIKIDLDANETLSWTREYTFFSRKKELY